MDKTLLHQDVFKLLEQWAPVSMAYDWDPVGLQIGSMSQEVENILVTLDVTEAVADEAIKNNVNLIIAHHPLLFRPLKNINTDSVKGRLVQKLLRHDITVYAAHTNLDVATGGVNDLLCEQLGLANVRILEETDNDPLLKVVVYVPDSHAENVRLAIGEAGGGYIGHYSHCTFNTKGKGTFKPTAQADPYIGRTNALTTVEETKIETIIPQSRLNPLVKAMVAAHPYEEAAYDIYEMANDGMTLGIGRIGQLPQKMSLQDLSDHAKACFDVPMVRTVGDLSKTIKKVAILGGSGDKFISAAMKKRADVLITGDLTFHAAQDALEAGMTLIDPGHHIEKVMKETVKQYLEQHFDTKFIHVYVSEIDTEPFKFV